MRTQVQTVYRSCWVPAGAKTYAALAAVCLVTFAGCQSGQRGYAFAGPSFLPQVGIAGGVGTVIERTPQGDIAVEVEGTYQFLDDADLVDDGNPGQGAWAQVRAGVRQRFGPRRGRSLVLRYGGVWFQQHGVTGIVDEPGNYAGGYAGVGFEAEVGPRLRVGPEIRLLIANGEGSIGWVLVPQVAWHFTFLF